MSPFGPRGPGPPKEYGRSVFLQELAARIAPDFLSIQTFSKSPCGMTAAVVGVGVSSAVAVPRPIEPIEIPSKRTIVNLNASFFLMIDVSSLPLELEW